MLWTPEAHSGEKINIKHRRIRSEHQENNVHSEPTIINFCWHVQTIYILPSYVGYLGTFKLIILTYVASIFVMMPCHKHSEESTSDNNWNQCIKMYWTYITATGK